MSRAVDSETIKDVSVEYPELMHYTNAAGLNGILSSQSIWATHASSLNDDEELKLFFNQRLPQIIHEVYEIYSRSRQSAIPPKIETFASEFAKDLGRLALDFNQTYLFSLCAPALKSIRRNGLLSQWRGYGTDGGYAIIFDTRLFKKLIKKESDAYHYQYMVFADVYYFDESHPSPIPPEIRQAEDQVRQWISECIGACQAE